MRQLTFLLGVAFLATAVMSQTHNERIEICNVPVECPTPVVVPVPPPSSGSSHPTMRPGDPVLDLTPEESNSLHDAVNKAAQDRATRIQAITKDHNLQFEAVPAGANKGQSTTVVDLSHETTLAVPVTISQDAMKQISSRAGMKQ
jgi:hypothetical protein